MFKNIPLDEGVTIIQQHQDKIKDYDVVLQYWIMDGISAISAIFLTSDVVGYSDEELEDLVKKECNTDTVTLSRGEDYTFVNYDFKIL